MSEKRQAPTEQLQLFPDKEHAGQHDWPCPACDGTGRTGCWAGCVPAELDPECDECRGTGFQYCDDCVGMGRLGYDPGF